MFFLALLLALVFPVPAHALSWSDIFPPVQLQQSTQKAIEGQPFSRETKSLDSYSNDSSDSTTCNWQTGVSNSWSPDKECAAWETGADGNQVCTEERNKMTEYRDMEGNINLADLPHNFFRDSQTWFSRGGISCDPKLIQKQLTDQSMEGYGTGTRISDYHLSLYLRGLLLDEAVKASGEEIASNTIGQDEPLVYYCGGQCKSLSDKSASSCRPITLSEVAYYFFKKGIQKVYTDPTASTTLAFSSQISAFEANYNKRFPQTPFSAAPASIYDLIYRQLHLAPKANVNTPYTLVNQKDYDFRSNPPVPVPTTVNINMPQAGTAASVQGGYLWSLLSPFKQTPISSADPCTDVEITANAIDKPPQIGLIKFFKGLFAIKDEQHSESRSLSVSAKVENKLIKNTQKFENAVANFLPYQDQLTSGARNKPVSGRVSQDHPPVPGNKADYLYSGSGKYSFVNAFTPSSWHF